MKRKLQVQYNLDKLHIYYETPKQGLMTWEQTLIEYLDFTPPDYENQYGLIDVWPLIPRLVSFRLITHQKWQGKFRLNSPIWSLVCEINDDVIEIGKIKTHLKDAIILEVHNEFLYSDNLNLLNEFEKIFYLKFHSIKEIDICCDSNINLSRKLKTKLQNKDTLITRPGRKNYLTPKGNIILCDVHSKAIKTLTVRERIEPSLYYELSPTGCNNKILKLVGYNKSKEIEESKKEYIKNLIPFRGTIYRMELRMKSSHLNYIRKKYKLTPLDIYSKITEKEFLEALFIINLNRFFNIKIKGQKTTLSKILCLDKSINPYLNEWLLRINIK